MKRILDVIADNGGGITIQCDELLYRHYYQDGEQVVDDLRAILDGTGIEEWDGNEYDPDDGMDIYDPEVERDGGYIWFEGTAKDILQQIGALDEDIAWENIKEMRRSI